VSGIGHPDCVDARRPRWAGRLTELYVRESVPCLRLRDTRCSAEGVRDPAPRS
jgi:hypothetical protein